MATSDEQTDNRRQERDIDPVVEVYARDVDRTVLRENLGSAKEIKYPARLQLLSDSIRKAGFTGSLFPARCHMKLSFPIRWNFRSTALPAESSRCQSSFI